MIADESRNGNHNPNIVLQDTNATQTVTATVIPLLAERLKVDVERRKVGDIVVRKEIETRLLQVRVPVRHEKLIVERVSPDYELLAKIDLQPEQDGNGASAIETTLSALGLGEIEELSIVYGEVNSPQAASDVLQEIANMSTNDCESIRIEILLKNSNRQDTYQQLIDRYGKN